MSQFFASTGQSIGVWSSASVLPMNSQDWFPLGWTGWISLKSKGLFSNTIVQKLQFFSTELSLALSFLAQTVKRLPTMRETYNGFNPQVGKISWRRKWQPTPVFLPGKSHGWRSLVGYSSWGCKESDMTERLHSLTHFLYSPNLTSIHDHRKNHSLD